MRAETAHNSCWTCRKRKIGCDRRLPACVNCTRTDRECMGYNIRLLWPDQPDGRRKICQAVYSPQSTENCVTKSRHYGDHFLNITSQDIVQHLRRKELNELVSTPILPALKRGLTSDHPLLGQERMLLAYYEQHISVMLSTTQTPNGFRSELLPLALSSDRSSSVALLNAIMAVSAFHMMGNEAALPFKSNAIRSLYNALHEESPRGSSEPPSLESNPLNTQATQIAACMMLCVYNVFDETEGNWHVHLDGAGLMVQGLAQENREEPTSGFLLSWFLQHEVMACFTQPLREKRQELDLLQLLESVDGDKSIIVGSSGCSPEILGIIHRINRIRASDSRQKDKSSRLHEELISEKHHLEDMLNSLTQQIPPEEDSSVTPLRRINILATAELFRLAAALYLFRVLPSDEDDQDRSNRLSEALSVLDTMSVASSPWPLLIIACEAEDDSARVQILRVLERMDSKRGVGNIRVSRAIIETFWKQMDLRADAGGIAGRDSQVQTPDWKWDDLVDCDPPVPWFV